MATIYDLINKKVNTTVSNMYAPKAKPINIPAAPMSPVIQPGPMSKYTPPVANQTFAQNPVTVFQPNGNLIPGLTYGNTPVTTPTQTPKKPVMPQAKPGSVATLPNAPIVTEPQATNTGIQGSATTPTPGSGYTFTETPEQKAERELREKIDAYNLEQFNTNIDPNQIYQNKLSEYQAQIDALNNVYNDQLAQARVQGQGRIESRQFAQGRSGQIGSGTGEAGINAVQDANRQIEESIQAERAAAIAAIMGKVRSGAAEELAAKTKAKKEGADAILANLAERPVRRKALLASTIKSLIEKGIDPKTMTPEEIQSIVNGIGVSQDEILSSYNEESAKAIAEREKALLDKRKTEADIKKIEADIKKGTIIELAEGGMIYDTVTGKTFKNPKTFAPKESSGTKDEKTYDAKTIPPEIKKELFSDIQKNSDAKRRDRKSLNDFIVAYPEINTTYLTELYEANK